MSNPQPLPLGAKPRLTKVHTRLWYCRSISRTGDLLLGIGPTPQEAYFDWMGQQVGVYKWEWWRPWRK